MRVVMAIDATRFQRGDLVSQLDVGWRTADVTLTVVKHPCVSITDK